MADDAFDDVRLPVDIERGAQIGPSFQTTIVTLTSGKEQRNLDWSQELLRADVGFGLMRNVHNGRPLEPGEIDSNFAGIMSFYRARRGQWRGFRFKDWSDYEAKEQLIGIGDGGQLDFPLFKVYGADTSNPYVRRITRPVWDTVAIFVDGVPANFAAAPVLGGPLGTIRLEVPAPVGVEVVASFEFDVPVRFNSDDIRVQLTHATAGAIPQIQLMGIRE